MARGILVIDIPKCCGDCPILEYCHNNDGKSDLSIRQPWCPLKELPEKMKYCNGTYNGEVKGWNKCIEEILKENKSNEG